MHLILALSLLSIDPVELARDGKAALAIVVGEKASPAVRATANDLAKYLSQISGGKFKIAADDTDLGIIVGRPSDFSRPPLKVEFGSGPFEREDYILRSRPRALYLLGASDLAVSHAVWDLLDRLTKVYMSPAAEFPAPRRPGYVVRYTIGRIGGVGPWVSPKT